MQLANIHSLRAIAIIIIVFNHAMFFQFDWSHRQTSFNVLDDLFSNGTVIFVFVAGYLFQYLLPRFTLKRYYLSKITNVVLPYIFVSIPAIAYSFLTSNPSDAYPNIAHLPTWLQVVWYFAVGGAHVNYPLWFIPMIIIFFMLAPLFKFIAQRPKLYWCILPLFILTDTIHREPFPLIDPIRQFIYFLPVYLLGMWACQFREIINQRICQNLTLLGGALALLIAIEIGLFSTHGIYETKEPFTFPMGFVDWLLLQKLMLCFFLIGLFEKYPRLNNRPLNYVAKISFAIFFLHAYFLFAIKILLNYEIFDASVTLWFVRGVVCLALCAAAASSAKVILGKRSRYFIGY